LSASAPSSHDLSSAAFTINMAESNFRHTHRAVVAQRGHDVEEPIAILSPNDKVSIKVIPFDPFQNANGAESIKVLVRWRSVKRGAFSRSSVASRINVRDVRDLKLAIERKQPRIRFV
jgi:hypothetical protein